jgi:hypothetical protein
MTQVRQMPTAPSVMTAATLALLMAVLAGLRCLQAVMGSVLLTATLPKVSSAN